MEDNEKPIEILKREVSLLRDSLRILLEINENLINEIPEYYYRQYNFDKGACVCKDVSYTDLKNKVEELNKENELLKNNPSEMIKVYYKNENERKKQLSVLNHENYKLKKEINSLKKSMHTIHSSSFLNSFRLYMLKEV